MRRHSLRAAATALVALTAAACGSGGSKDVPSATSLVPIGAGVSGPSGLVARIYAKGPPRLSAFAFDESGRLWVATSGATAHADDAVYVVPRAGAPPRRMITGLRGPLGLVCYRSRLYVASLGRVTMFSGLRGRRFAARRTIVYGPVRGGREQRPCAGAEREDLMAVSASCDHCVPATLNQRDDLGAATPGDELVVVHAGDDWKFPACHRQRGAACAGVPPAVGVLDKHAAAGGVAIVTHELSGRFAPSALVGEWQLGRVKRVALRRTKSGYTRTVTTFLTGIANPLPMVTTESGAVLVGDWQTGTIYEISAGRRGDA